MLTKETKMVQDVEQVSVSIQSQTNPLIEAVKGNNQPEFDRLLALIKPGTIDEEVDDKGYTALHWAAGNGHKHFIGPLIAAGAKIDKKGKDGITTPILVAIAVDSMSAIEAFHTAGVDLNALVCEIDGNIKASPLYVAVGLGKIWAMLAFCQAGVSVNVANADGRTPVFAAVENERIYPLHFKMRTTANVALGNYL